MATRYWVGGSGVWDYSTDTNWSETSGGLGGASNPTISTDVVFDANSFTAPGQTVTLNVSGSSAPSCSTVTFAGVTNTPTVVAGTATFVYVTGYSTGSSGIANLTLSPNMVCGSDVTFNITNGPTGSTCPREVNIDYAGIATGPALNVGAGGILSGFAQINILSNITTVGNIELRSPYSGYYAEINTNGYAISGYDVTFSGEKINFSTSEITASGNQLSINPGSGTTPVITGYPNINLTYTGGTYSSLDIAYVPDFTINTITARGGGEKRLSQSNMVGTLAITSLVIDPGETVKVKPNPNWEISSLYAVGTSSSRITMSSSTASVAYIEAQDTTVSYVTATKMGAVGSPVNDVPGGVDGGGNVNWCFPGTCGNLPEYNTSLITSINRTQQNLSTSQFIIGGRGGATGTTYALFKKSTTHAFSLWRSEVYKIGQEFDVVSISLNLASDLVSNMTIIPVLYFDNETSNTVGTTVNTTNYSGRFIHQTSANFSGATHGKHNFFLELRMSGSVLATVALPIFIDVDIKDS